MGLAVCDIKEIENTVLLKIQIVPKLPKGIIR